VIEALGNLQMDDISPRQALALLYEWQGRL